MIVIYIAFSKFVGALSVNNNITVLNLFSRQGLYQLPQKKKKNKGNGNENCYSWSGKLRIYIQKSAVDFAHFLSLCFCYLYKQPA